MEEQTESGSMEIDLAEAMTTTVVDAPENQEPEPKRKSPTPPVALPRFPLPKLPNAPSKSVLALQGLDQALVDAEIVDPATTLPVPAEGEDDGDTMLSAKTRKRLHELGISELFAGTSIPP